MEFVHFITFGLFIFHISKISLKGIMKIVVIGGRGLIGSKLIKILQSWGHEAVSASPSSGVDATTGKGLAEALKGAQVVIDVANSPSFDEKTAVEFFEKSSQHLSKAEKEAGVRHHVALSIVGTDRLSKDGYFRAKHIQEQLIKQSGIPYSIIQSTQFYEFLKSIADSATSEETVKLPPVAFQPIAGDDVASIIAEIAVKNPLNGAIEIAGPKRASFPEIIKEFLHVTQDKRSVQSDKSAGYFGMVVQEESLVPGNNPRLGKIALKEWINSAKG
jgi:uncharacterized protein YbjT (DUF2867 family)